MRAGDLVKMKYAGWWTLRGMPKSRRYTEKLGIVIEVDHNKVKVALQGENVARRDLAEHWELV